MAGETSNGSTQLSEATKRAQEAQAKRDASYKQFVEKSKAAGEQLKKTRETIRKSRKAVAEANAEELAAQEDGPISIGEALKLIDKEKETKRQHRDNEVQVLKESAAYMGQTLVMGFNLTKESLAAAGTGIWDSYANGSVVPVLAGGAAGMIFGDNMLSSTVSNGIRAWTTLRGGNSLAPGVDEKFVDGLGTEGDVADYLTANGNGTPNGFTDPGGTDPAPDKPIVTDQGASVPANEDALQTSDQEMSTMSELGKAFDDALKVFEQSDNLLVSSVATFVDTHGGAKVLSPAMQALENMLARQDQQQGGPEAGDDSPSYPA